MELLDNTIETSPTKAYLIKIAIFYGILVCIIEYCLRFAMLYLDEFFGLFGQRHQFYYLWHFGLYYHLPTTTQAIILNFKIKIIMKNLIKLLSFFVAIWLLNLMGCSVNCNIGASGSQDWFNKGVAAQNLDEQIANYTKAIEIDPDYGKAFVNRGIAKYNSGRFQEAINDYTQAMRLLPDDPKPFNNRGNAKRELGQNTEALLDYGIAIRIDTNCFEALTNRGITYGKLGKQKEAIADHNQAIRLQPNYALLYYNRATTNQTLGKYTESLPDYDQAIQLEANFLNAYYNRGLSNKNLGNYTPAIKDFKKVLELDATDAGAYANIGCCLVSMKDKMQAKEAIEWLDKSLSIHANMPWAVDCRTTALQQLEQ